MHQFDLLPFPPGTTYSQNGSPAATDGQEHEGKMFWVEDLDYTLSPFKPRAYAGSPAGEGSYRLLRVVRNTSGIALQPGRLGTMDLSKYGRAINGYATTTGAEAFPIDEFIPYNVPANDLFYIVLSGTASIYSGLDGASANGLANASTTEIVVMALTAATSQATTAGRIAAQDLTGATAVLGNNIQNRIGVCLSARTTNQTNTLTLCYIYNDW